jgi:PAS domain S-box-containing protein
VKSISSLPIRRQLIVLLVIAVGLSALLSAGALAIYESFTYHPRLVSDLRGNAATMADMIAPAVDFGDDATAEKQLAILNRRNGVWASAVFLPPGTLFASHKRAEASVRIPERLPAASVDGAEIDNAIILLQPVQVDGRPLGSLWVVMETPSLAQRLTQYATLAGVSLLSLATLALVLSFALRRAISTPIRRLSEAAQAVSENKDYAVRVRVDESSNEVGRLAKAFNQMLEAVQTRERENHERQTRLARQAQGMAELVHLEAETRGDIPAALQRLVRIMAEVQQVGRVGIWLLDESGTQLKCAAGFDLAGQAATSLANLQLPAVPAYEEALRTRPVVEIPDFAADPIGIELRAAHQGFAGIGAMLDIPLRRRGRIVGVLCHLQSDGPRRWWPEEVRFAVFAADHITMHFEAHDAQVATDHLQASEERFRHLVENSSELIALIDHQGRYLYASPNHQALVGHQPEAMIGRTVFEYINSDDLSPAELARRFAGNGDESRALFRYRCHNGQWRWFESSGRRFQTASGEARAVVVSRDVTEERLSKERFATIFNHSPVGFVITSIETSEIVDVNEAGAQLVGRSREKLIGLKTDELTFWAPGERQRVVEQVIGDRKLHVVEKPLRRQDGSVRTVQAHFTAIEIGGQLRLLVALLDVSESRRAEATLRESEERYRTLINEAKDAIFTLAPDGRILELNEAVETITGWDRKLWIGRNFVDPLLPEDRQRATAIFAEVLAGGHPPSFDLQIRSRTGTMLDLEFAVSAHYKDGEVVGLLGIGRDVTERKRAALAQSRLEAQLRQAQKMESIGTLAGGIAHDFNNMLTGIMGNTQLASMDLPAGHPVQEFLRGASRSSARARDLVRQILTFSRQGEQKIGPLSIELLLKEVLEFLRPTLPANIALVPRIGRNLPLILGDPTMLHQVVLNLVTNSLHAIGEAETGQIEVIAEETVVDEAMVAQKPNLRLGRNLRLTVTDTGCGMDAMTVERIFEPFFTTKEQGKGTGLGLSVVHGIIQQHNAAIVVYSAPGRGTSFQIYFPVSEGTAKAANTTGNSDLDVIPGSGRIMVVDDEDLVITVAKRFLQRAGYKVEAFTDARVAHRELAAHPADFDLLLVDLTMPGMKGTTLASLARELRPDMPVILATGFSGDLSKEKLEGHGVGELISKPFTCRSLTSAVRRALDGALRSRLGEPPASGDPGSQIS